MTRVAEIAEYAAKHGLKAKCELTITPGSEQIRATMERDGILEKLEAIGATVLANACGPCIGQWKRHDVKKGDKNSIITSFNRNFSGRNDGNPDTHAFVASPETVLGFALAGDLRIDFTKQPINGSVLNPPRGEELPQRGFVPDPEGYVPPAEDGSSIEVIIKPDSQRLQKLEPFPPPRKEEFRDMVLLLKVKGKCTTDHISPAGPWLRYRGHLDNISNNMFTGATNAFTGKLGMTKNVFTGQEDEVPKVARDYKARGVSWIVVGEENYGEGSSREHAAMEPRYLGGKVILVKSFARIHETNLKKQGMLPLVFDNPADYDLIGEEDRFTLDLDQLRPGEPMELIVRKPDGREHRILVRHSMNAHQIEWFWAGSALNLMAKRITQKVT